MTAKKSTQTKSSQAKSNKAAQNGQAKATPELTFTSEEDGPVELIAAEAEERGEAEQIPLFTLNGTTYSMGRPRANLGLRYLWQVKTLGPDIASLNLLETVIGREGVEALINFDGLEVEHFNMILRRLEAIVLGDAEDTGKGSESNTPEQPSAAGS